MGTLLWGWCASCTPVDSCCHNNCNNPQQCTKQALTPEFYDKAPAGPAAAIAILPAATVIAAPPPVFVEPAYTGVLNYSPPDLYLLNSAILA